MKNIRFSFLCFFSCLMISLTYAQNGLDFDGVDDYVQTGYNGLAGSGSRTLEAWIKADNVAGQMVIVDMGTLGTGTRFTFNVLNGKLRVEIQGDGKNGTSLIGDSNWHHVAVTYDDVSKKFSLYVDGSLELNSTMSKSVNTGSAVSLRIGSRIDAVKFFKGSIDEVRVWNYARSQSEISADMNVEYCGAKTGLVAYHKMNHGIASGTNTSETLSVDDSGNNNDGTLNGFSLSGATSNWVAGQSLTVESVSETQMITECDGYSITIGSNTYTSTGVYTDTIVGGSVEGCDSIIITDITITPSATETQTITACIGYSITVGSNTYTETGIFTDVIEGGASNGCDSIITTDLTISSSITETQTITDCEGYSITVLNNTYTTTGVYKDTIEGGAVGGCDSVIITDLTINSPTTGIQTITACPPYAWIDGNSYTEDNSSANYTLTNVAGCDSVVTLNLTIQDANECVPDFNEVVENAYLYSGVLNESDGNYDVVFLQTQSNVTYYLFDNSGSLLNETSIQSVDRISINLTGYASGAYYLQIRADGPSNSIKIDWIDGE